MYISLNHHYFLIFYFLSFDLLSFGVLLLTFTVIGSCAISGALSFLLLERRLLIEFERGFAPLSMDGVLACEEARLEVVIVFLRMDLGSPLRLSEVDDLRGPLLLHSRTSVRSIRGSLSRFPDDFLVGLSYVALPGITKYRWRPSAGCATPRVLNILSSSSSGSSNWIKSTLWLKVPY